MHGQKGLREPMISGEMGSIEHLRRVEKLLVFVMFMYTYVEVVEDGDNIHSTLSRTS